MVEGDEVGSGAVAQEGTGARVMEVEEEKEGTGARVMEVEEDKDGSMGRRGKGSGEG